MSSPSSSWRSIIRWNAGESPFWQTFGAIATWGYVVALHWNNSGLWYQGDAPTHAANGLFWWDFLSRFPVHPVHFALSYYARYPVISPIAYPPVFYLLEGVCYRLFGVSPFVAKGLVLGFVLLGTFYVIAWLRQWVGAAAGWAGILFTLQPAVIIWGHAVMLSVPSTALGIAALYHWRRWLGDPLSRQIYLAAAFAWLAIFTYLPTVVVVLVMICWSVAERKVRALFDGRIWVAAGVVLGCLLPWAWLSAKWDAGYRQVALYLGEYPYWDPRSWVYYSKEIPHMVALPLLVLAFCGLGLGLRSKRWRKETSVAGIWFAVCYLWFSVFSVKEPRYVLLLVPPIVLLGAIGVVSILQAFQDLPAGRNSGLVLVGLLLMIAYHVRVAHSVPVPRVEGFEEIVAYVRSADSNHWVFYDGNYSGLFSYYFRAADPKFTVGVVRASKLLYATKIDAQFGLVEYVSSSDQVMDLLQRQCGCKFFVVERQMPGGVPAEHYLRESLTGGAFRLLHSFRVETPRVADVDLYEYTGGFYSPMEYELHFPLVSDRAAFRVRPIEP